MLLIQMERVEDCWAEVMALATLHWEGTKTYRRHYPFKPDYEKFKFCNEQNIYHLFTVRTREKQLVGYAGFYVAYSMHSQHLMATEDTFFLHPDHRGGRTALRFLQHIENQCQQWGVEELLFSHEQDNESGIHRLLNLLDFKPVIVQYSKRLSTVSPADSGQPSPTEATHHVGAA